MPLEVTIPPWLKGPSESPASVFLEAYGQGARVALEQARLREARAQNAMEAEQRSQALAMEMAAKQQALEMGMLKAQEELAVDKAYKDSLIGVRESEVAIEAQKTQMVADQAARKFAAQQGMSELLKKGVSIDQALFANPDLLTPGVTEALVRSRAQAKQYGTPTVKDVEGLPGAKMIYREGSPGVHVVQPRADRDQLTAMQKATVADKIAALERSKALYPKNAPEIKSIDSSIKRYQSLLDQETISPAIVPPAPTPTATGTAPPAQPAPPAAAPKTKYPEGTVLRKKDGSRWIVIGGDIVPYTTSYPEER